MDLARSELMLTLVALVITLAITTGYSVWSFYRALDDLSSECVRRYHVERDYAQVLRALHDVAMGVAHVSEQDGVISITKTSTSVVRVP